MVLTKMVETGSSSPLVTEYLGQFVHGYTVGGTSSLKYIITPEGRLKNTGTNAAPIWSWDYNLNDHLGNVRAVIAQTTNAGYANVLQQVHYFPFGMVMSQISSFTSGSKNKYRSTAKSNKPDRHHVLCPYRPPGQHRFAYRQRWRGSLPGKLRCLGQANCCA